MSIMTAVKVSETKQRDNFVLVDTFEFILPTSLITPSYVQVTGRTQGIPAAIAWDESISLSDLTTATRYIQAILASSR